MAALLPGALRALDEECKDPLFELHWQGRIGYTTMEAEQLGSLNGYPTVKNGMTLCPRYNGKASCCNVEFESEQMKFFDHFRKTILPSKIARIDAYRRSIEDVMLSPAYHEAGRAEHEQFALVIESFNPVLEGQPQAECFRAILAYAAGMSCFACRPDWVRFVTMLENQVVRVNVHPAVCMGLWSECETFALSVTMLQQAVLDSLLAKQARMQKENLSMFADLQALCDWLHDSVALHPFIRPAQSELEDSLEPAAEATKVHQDEPLREAPGAWLRPFITDGLSENLDVLGEGTSSGFPLEWTASPSSAVRGAQPWAALRSFWLSLVALLACPGRG